MTRNTTSKRTRASLVVPWIRIHQPVQETRFDPWSRKIPHGSEKLSPCTTAAEAGAPKPVLYKTSHHGETPTHLSERQSPLERARVQQRRPSTTKKKKKKKVVFF